MIISQQLWLTTTFKRTHRERKIEEEQNVLDGRRTETHGCRDVEKPKVQQKKKMRNYATHLAKWTKRRTTTFYVETERLFKIITIIKELLQQIVGQGV